MVSDVFLVMLNATQFFRLYNRLVMTLRRFAVPEPMRSSRNTCVSPFVDRCVAESAIAPSVLYTPPGHDKATVLGPIA